MRGGGERLDTEWKREEGNWKLKKKWRKKTTKTWIKILNYEKRSRAKENKRKHLKKNKKIKNDEIKRQFSLLERKVKTENG